MKQKHLSLGAIVSMALALFVTAALWAQTGSSPSFVNLSSSGTPSTFGQLVSITATVPSGATGTVSFTVDGGAIGSDTVRNSQVVFNSSELTPGPHTIVASYSGDSTFMPATSSPFTQTVGQGTLAISVSSSASTAAYGALVSITASVSSTSTPTQPAPTGTITFNLDNGAFVGSDSISNNAATFNSSELAPGQHTIVASYSGDSNWAAVTSSPFTETIGQGTPTITLSSSVNPSTTGQAIGVTATLSDPTGTPVTGSITFNIDNGAFVGSDTVRNNAVTFNSSELSSGIHLITATYGGDSNWKPVTSAQFKQIIYAPLTQASSNSFGSTSSLFHSVSSMTPLTTAQKIAALQQKVKYVFVIFQENRSYDHYFGSYPGANGLFATYPGASSTDPGAQPGNTFPSFNSTIQTVTPSGSVTYSTVSPFLVPRAIVNQAGNTTSIYPEDMYSVDHSHTGYIADLHSDQATRSAPKNDGYPLDQQGLYYNTDNSGVAAAIYSTSTHAAPTSNATLQSKQKGEIVMGHVDCDTIPFMWQYADRFTLFDNMHQTAIGPSTPNAIAMIGAQTGDTQWVLHPNNYDSYSITYGNPTAVAHIQYSLPNLTDTPPFPGSASDNAAVKPPYGPDESSGQGPTTIGTPKAGQEALTFASLPLSFMGTQVTTITAADQHSTADLADVQQDMQTIAVQDPNVPWGWYQQGYGPEPFDGTTFNDDEANYTAAPEHASYIVHHNGPQYFGYLGDNTTEQGNMHGLQQFYTDVANSNLNPTGGVYYIRGGYYNNLGQAPVDPNPTVASDFGGNDDHGSYSDSQISESLVAASINAIANSPYWSQSAIIVTYDESDGFFDHQPEQFRTWGPDGEPETGGPRIPLMVISPYAVTHGVSHYYSEHSSVIRFVEELEGLVPLAQLPNEAAAFATGAGYCTTPPTYSGTPTPTLVLPGAQSTSTTINPFCKPNGSPQTALGPADTYLGIGDLTEAFDNDRLLGNVAPLPASYVTIPTATVTTLPHYGATGACANPALNIVPTDYANGYSSTPFDPTGAQTAVPVIDPPPADFNPRPTVSNGSPYYNTSNNTTANSPNGTGTTWPQ
jgi:phospholipase C